MSLEERGELKISLETIPTLEPMMGLQQPQKIQRRNQKQTGKTKQKKTKLRGTTGTKKTGKRNCFTRCAKRKSTTAIQ